MCGIVGIINKDGTTVEPSVISAMTHVIRHRGPDDDGVFVDGKVGFGFKRLSIIDLKTGHQPMTTGPYTIVFTGEI
jgi:asparagine synthase (glutamine-hydrolysing)